MIFMIKMRVFVLGFWYFFCFMGKLIFNERFFIVFFIILVEGCFGWGVFMRLVVEFLVSIWRFFFLNGEI